MSTRQPLAPSPSLHHLVRKSAPADLATMGSVLAVAFHDDPVVSWIVPEDRRRRADLPTLMRLFAARLQPHGENHVNETGTGAAVWAPPGATFTPADDAWFEAELAATADGPPLWAMWRDPQPA